MRSDIEKRRLRKLTGLLELFDLTDDPDIRGHLFLSTGIGMRVWFLGEKEPDPKEGPYLVLERVNPENRARLRVTAFDDTSTALQSREVDWAPRSLLDAARLETVIEELALFAVRFVKPNPPPRREGRYLDPAFKIFRTIKVEDVMRIVEEALEHERRTGLKITNETNFLPRTKPLDLGPKLNCTCMLLAPGQIPCKIQL